MGGGGSSSRGASDPSNPVMMNPAAGVIANMFGIGTGFEGGGMNYAGPGQGYMGFSRPTFGGGDFDDIAKLLDAPNMGAEGARGVGGGWADYLSGTVDPTMREGLETGFRTDMDPIISEAQRVYRDETIPQLKQQFAGQTGSFSSDFLDSTARAGGAMGSQLGAMQAQMDESASNRRAGLLPMAGIPGELASMGLDLGAQYNLDATSGGRAATMLQMLGGMEPTAISRSPYQNQKAGSFNLGLKGGG
jgi:hypothetical protein